MPHNDSLFASSEQEVFFSFLRTPIDAKYISLMQSFEFSERLQVVTYLSIEEGCVLVVLLKARLHFPNPQNCVMATSSKELAIISELYNPDCFSIIYF